MRTITSAVGRKLTFVVISTDAVHSQYGKVIAVPVYSSRVIRETLLTFRVLEPVEGVVAPLGISSFPYDRFATSESLGVVSDDIMDAIRRGLLAACDF